MLGRLFFFVTIVMLSGYLQASAWPSQSCASRHRLPVDITAGASGHSGELRVDLAGSDFPATYDFSTTGDDIRILESDDVTPIDYVVTAWNAVAKTATLYLRPTAFLASETRTVNIYFGDPSLPEASNPTAVFPTTGLHLQSRVSTVDPIDEFDAIIAFTNATVDVYNAPIASVTGLNNVALGGSTNDYAWCISTMIEVTPATAGVWSFRYGADFGRGGHLKIGGTMLESEWDKDLWWGADYANTANTLEGSIALPAGFHRYEALGFEDCCDGSVGWEAQAPGGAWLDFSSTNFPVRAARCVTTAATITKQAPESCPVALQAAKTVSMIIDPGNDASAYALPGSLARYSLAIVNPGQPVDGSSLILADQLPADTALVVDGPTAFELVDGTPPSALTFTWSGPSSTTDDVDFSTDGVTWNYSPVAGGSALTDPAVTHVRFRPQGVFAPSVGSDEPSFDIHFSVQLE